MERLLLHRSEPEWRAVLEDALIEHGGRIDDALPTDMIRVGDGGGGGDGDGDGGGDGGGVGDGDGVGDGGGDGDGGGVGGGDGGGEFTRSEIVKDGLYIITSPSGGYCPYVRVGWLERQQGDEFVLRNARIIKRFGSYAHLTQLALAGPKTDTQLLDMHPGEPVHRLHVLRPLPCDPKAWAEACPKPDGAYVQLGAA